MRLPPWLAGILNLNSRFRHGQQPVCPLLRPTFSGDSCHFYSRWNKQGAQICRWPRKPGARICNWPGTGRAAGSTPSNACDCLRLCRTPGRASSSQAGRYGCSSTYNPTTITGRYVVGVALIHVILQAMIPRTGVRVDVDLRDSPWPTAFQNRIGRRVGTTLYEDTFQVDSFPSCSQHRPCGQFHKSDPQQESHKENRTVRYFAKPAKQSITSSAS